MCIICVKPKDIVLTKSTLKTCFRNNPHGAGFAYPDSKEDVVKIEKGFFSFRAFWLRYRVIQDLNLPMLIHFRVATSGLINLKNCHPWRINKKYAMVHNGVIQGKIGMQDDHLSDTGLYVKHILQPTFKENELVWKNPAYKWVMELAIGKNNKVSILDSKGDFVIINESEGKWENGVWFSNETFKTARKSIASTKDRWIEERDGKKWEVQRKTGGKIRYKIIENSIVTTKSTNETILGFARKATGVPIDIEGGKKEPDEEIKASNSPLEQEQIDISMFY